MPRLDPSFDDVSGVKRLRLLLRLHYDIPPPLRGVAIYGPGISRRERLVLRLRGERYRSRAAERMRESLDAPRSL